MANYTSQGTVAPALPALVVPHPLLEELKVGERVHDALSLRAGELAPKAGEAEWLALWRAIGGQWELDPDGLHFLYVEEHVHEAMADLLQLVLRHAPEEIEYLTLTYALRCDRMVADAFGGGACFITRDQRRWWGTGTWLAAQLEAFQTAATSATPPSTFVTEVSVSRALSAVEQEDVGGALAAGARHELRTWQRQGHLPQDLEVTSIRVTSAPASGP
ncbi:MAG: hypothetical protein ABIL09_26200 [Gemmatimonadota bacterium]